MTSTPKEELRPCPFCGSKIITNEKELYCATKDCLWSAFGKLSFDHIKEWQNAYCWKVIEKQKAKIKEYRDIIKHFVGDIKAVDEKICLI